MPTGEIVDRGRGPELAGTRITVYRIMDYSPDEYSPSEIAAELGITEDEVRLAHGYIAEHCVRLAAEYSRIMADIERGNPPGVEEGRARTIEELRRRIVERKG